MIRFIKVYVIMYIVSILFIVGVVGSSIIPMVAIPTAKITIMTTLLWCWYYE